MSVPHGCVLLVVTGISRNQAGGAAFEPDAAQTRVIEHSGGPLLCLAGPGTGKTTALTAAVAARSWDSSSLVLTFSKAAAADLRERLAATLGEGLLPTVATFHSLAYAIVREFGAKDSFGRAPRLLGGAEQEQRLRELLTFAVKEGRVPWPPELAAAVGTAGLAKQVRLLLSRAQLLGFGPEELANVARNASMPEWEALADFLGEYLDVFEALGVLDYSELIARAVAIVTDPGVCGQLRDRYSAIYVDEYQDTDYAQVQLLQALTTPTSTLVVVGDPDQAIYGFRGADVDGILRFREDFPTADGSLAPVVVLRDVRRFGSSIGAASQRVISRVGLGTLPGEVRRDHRAPRYVSALRDEVEVLTFDSVAAQAGGIADRIRRARLHGDVVSWSDIAVIVRSRTDVPSLQHALDSAGIPVTIDSASESLAGNRAVNWLLTVLQWAVDPSSLSAESARALLSSAPMSVNAIGLRGLVRSLRSRVRMVNGLDSKRVASDELIRACLVDPSVVDPIDQNGQDQPAEHPGLVGLMAFQRLVAIVEQVRDAAEKGDSVSEILWAVWSATDWADRLFASSTRPGRSGATANRDLDSVIRLFDLSQNLGADLTGVAGIRTWVRDLREQDFSDLGAAGTSDSDHGDLVSVVTAHSAKGRQWPVVFVAGAQESTWPDLSHRSSLLTPERLSDTGIDSAPTIQELLEADRRLFYVACTRASQQLVVTAVESSDPGARCGLEPSRFLEEVGADDSVVRTHVSGLAVAGLNLAGLVAELRATVESESASGPLKTAAADRLAALAAAGVRSAHPSTWWGIHDWTQSQQPVRPSDQPVRISGSSWDSIERCSLRWFLEHEVRAQVPSGPATAFGTVVHAVADAITRGRLEPRGDDLSEELEQIWGSMGYPATWQARAELDEAIAAVRRFTNWQVARPDRTVLGSEIKFEQEVDVGGEQVVVSGVVDRLESDADGQLHIVDLKTQRNAISSSAVAEHRQLSLYQVVAHEGAFCDDDAQPAPVGGAELVQLRVGVAGADLPKVQEQGAIDPQQVRDSLALAVKTIRNEDFAPNPSQTQCRTCTFAQICPAQRPEGRN